MNFELGILRPFRKYKSNVLNLLPCLICVASCQIAYLVGVHMEEARANQGGHGHGLSPEMRQLGTVGAVKIAVRSSSMAAGPSKP